RTAGAQWIFSFTASMPGGMTALRSLMTGSPETSRIGATIVRRIRSFALGASGLVKAKNGHPAARYLSHSEFLKRPLRSTRVLRAANARTSGYARENCAGVASRRYGR